MVPLGPNELAECSETFFYYTFIFLQNILYSLHMRSRYQGEVWNVLCEFIVWFISRSCHRHFILHILFILSWFGGKSLRCCCRNFLSTLINPLNTRPHDNSNATTHDVNPKKIYCIFPGSTIYLMSPWQRGILRRSCRDSTRTTWKLASRIHEWRR